MKIVRKWKNELQTIEFPNYEKYTDNEILKIIYKDVPGRLALLNWIAVKISGEDPSKFNMSKEDVGRFFCERGLLNKRLEKDFIQARCSEILQEETWKILFSFTRMHKFLNPPKTDHVGIQDKFSELFKSSFGESKSFLEREASVTIEEIDSEIADSDLDRIVEAEVREIKKEIEKRTNEAASEPGSGQFRGDFHENVLKEESEPTASSSSATSNDNDLQQMVNDKAKRTEFKPFTLLRDEATPLSLNPNPKEYQESNNVKKKLSIPLFPSHHSIKDIKMSNDEPGKKKNRSESGLQSGEFENREKKAPKEWFKENEVIPRLYVMPGSPPLGNLDPQKIKIVIEDTAPPISLDGNPYHNHSQWIYRIYEVKNPYCTSVPLEQFKAMDRRMNITDEERIQ